MTKREEVDLEEVRRAFKGNTQFFMYLVRDMLIEIEYLRSEVKRLSEMDYLLSFVEGEDNTLLKTDTTVPVPRRNCIPIYDTPSPSDAFHFRDSQGNIDATKYLPPSLLKGKSDES